MHIHLLTNIISNQFLYNKKLQSLEKCMMNILFDSDILPIANKIDKLSFVPPISKNKIYISALEKITLHGLIDKVKKTCFNRT